MLSLEAGRLLWPWLVPLECKVHRDSREYELLRLGYPERLRRYSPGFRGELRRPAGSKIELRVYPSRMGNGDEASQDSYKLRGHRWLQITGKASITSYAASVGMPVDDCLADLKTIPGAAASAL
jgi:predicted chitinase